MKSFVSTPSSILPSQRGRHRLFRAAEAALLLVLTAGAVWLWTAPQRQEKALKQASLRDLLRMAGRDPDNPRIFYYEGMRLSQLQQGGPAVAAFARAAALDSDDEASWLGWAAAAATFQDAQQAFGILTTYVQKHPQSARAHFVLSQIYQQKKAYARAYEEAAKAAKLRPEDADAWRLMGTAAMSRARLQDAEPAMRRAVLQGPSDWQNQIGLGNVLMESKRLPEAEACFRAGTRLAPGQALPHLALGSALLTHANTPSELEAARRELLDAQRTDPDNPSLWLILAQSYTKEQRWVDARRMLERAIETGPGVADAHFELARVCRRLGDKEGAERETRRHHELTDHSEAELELGVKARAGNDLGARLKLARLLSEHGEYGRAADIYTSLVARDPHNGIAVQELGDLQRLHSDALRRPLVMALPDQATAPVRDLLRDADLIFEHKRYAEAEHAYRGILARDPESALANQGVGLALDAQQNTDDAFRYLNRAIARNPHLDRARFAVARLYEAAGFPGEAAGHLRAAVRDVPNSAEYWHELGQSRHEIQRFYTEAEAAFRRAVALAPERSDYVLDLATLLANSNKTVEAEQNFRHGLALAPDDVRAQYLLAHFLLDHTPTLQSQETAAQLLNRAHAKDANHAGVLYDLGRVALQRNQGKQAVEYLEQAAERAPLVATTWYQLGRAYQRTGAVQRSTEALKQFRILRDFYTDLFNTEEQAVQSPNVAGIRLNLARLYAREGEYAKAINQYQRCLTFDAGNKPARQEVTRLMADLKATGRLPAPSVFNGIVYASVKMR